MTVVLKGYILVPASDLAEVERALPTHVVLTRREAGCLQFEVTKRGGEPCRYDVYESFRDRQAFEAHQQRIVGTEWEAVTRNVTRHYDVQGLD